jgi:hypothetical protein
MFRIYLFFVDVATKNYDVIFSRVFENLDFLFLLYFFLGFLLFFWVFAWHYTFSSGTLCRHL